MTGLRYVGNLHVCVTFCWAIYSLWKQTISVRSCPDPRTQTCGVQVRHALTRSGATTSVRRGAAFISHRTPLTSSLMSTLEAPATKTALATPSSEKFEIATWTGCCGRNWRLLVQREAWKWTCCFKRRFRVILLLSFLLFWHKIVVKWCCLLEKTCIA